MTGLIDRARLVVVPIFYAVSLFASNTVNASELSISVANISPLFFDEEHPSKLGKVTSRLDFLLKEAGYHPVFSFFPWKRAEVTAATGETDATIIWTNIGHLENEFAISKNFLNQSVGFLTLASYSGAPLKNYSDAANILVGTVHGDSLGHELSGRGIPFTSILEITSAIKMLQARRMDAFLVHELSVTGFVKNVKNGAQLHFHSVENLPTYFAVSIKRKDAVEIIEKFNKTLKGLSNL